ncbi:hypothetical protein A4A49_64742, partial [Nicotiana attenuata]
LKVGLVGMIETRIKNNKVEGIVSKMFGGWEHFSNHNAHYNGRILIVWRPEYYKIRVVYESAQAVTCEVFYVPIQKEFITTFVYAHNSREERRELWEYINRGIGKKPWLVLGDFNSILHMEDRIGGNKVTINEVKEFQECIDKVGLTEFPNNGCRHTWNDKHDGGRIFSKID